MEIKHMGLKKYALSDVCTIVPGFAFKSNDFGSGENIAVKIKDIEPPSVNIKNAERVCFTPQNKFRLSEGDYIMAMTGATIGKVGKLQIDAKNVYINQRVCKFNPITSVCDKEYLYYVLSTSSFRNFIYNNVDSKLAQPNIGHTTIYKYTHLFPSNIKEQKLIASVLNNIDRKIELNKQINDNLEAMARQLYDYWFVQFDFPNKEGKPYKSSGGAMVYNERLKREVPIGWEVENLIDFAEIKNGATPSTADEANYGGDIVWITPKDLSDQQSKFVYQGERNITEQGFDSCSTSILPTNSVLMSSRAPIGLVSIAKHEVCTNQGFKSFIPKSISDSIYLYYYIKHNIKQIEQLGTGTTFKEVSRDDLCKFPILTIGAKDIYVQWIELQNGIADKQLALTKEIAALTKQRDELLPLLMNGQASVNSN
ncbi:MAG: restriction endonuclease subunit S [Prevotella stercorea]|nr:restriction endonuclease subunit S [Leyella stercorea]